MKPRTRGESPSDSAVLRARSLADGQGYREAALPGNPWQTKYPPGYPVMLAAILKANPAARDFWIIAHSWLWLVAASVALAWAMLQAGLSAVQGGVVAALWAANPAACYVGTAALSEALYCALLFLAAGPLTCWAAPNRSWSTITTSRPPGISPRGSPPSKPHAGAGLSSLRAAPFLCLLPVVPRLARCATRLHVLWAPLFRRRRKICRARRFDLDELRHRCPPASAL